MKQDITPQRRHPRGAIQVPIRGMPVSRVSSTTYTRETRVMSDVFLNEQVIVDETLTTVYADEPAESTPAVKAIESLSPEAKAAVLRGALYKVERELKRERRRRKDLKRSGLILIAAIFVLVTGYVSVDTWITNNRVKAENPAGSTHQASVATAKQSEGSDTTPIPPNTVSKYVVAADLPRELTISKIGVTARILPMSVNSDDSIQAPTNVFDSGWYTGSVKPGEYGAMFIDGHSSGSTHQGLFGNLDKLINGDRLQVDKGDGTKLTYKVVHTELVNLSDVDMAKMLTTYAGVTKGLNLMTCSGQWIKDNGTKTLDERILVFTEQVS
jgi:LPXTG-site transpeptidase (sortase) family protein